MHTLLYRNNTTESINFQKYIEDIVSELIYKYTEEYNIDYEILIDQKKISSEETVLLGLIVNEAVTNSIKYAFAEIKKPKISITFSENTKKIKTLSINDNGVGIKENNMVNNVGLGSKIISLLAEQINGNLKV